MIMMMRMGSIGQNEGRGGEGAREHGEGEGVVGDEREGVVVALDGALEVPMQMVSEGQGGMCLGGIAQGERLLEARDGGIVPAELAVGMAQVEQQRLLPLIGADAWGALRSSARIAGPGRATAFAPQPQRSLQLLGSLGVLLVPVGDHPELVPHEPVPAAEPSRLTRSRRGKIKVWRGSDLEGIRVPAVDTGVRG